MKYLYLFRHADTLPPEGDQSDHERMLSALGQEEAIRIGHFLKEEGLRPQKALCSTAVRTRTTLGLTAKTLGETIEAEFLHALYLAAPGELLHQVNSMDDAVESMMIVGHNPGIHQFAAMLANHGRADVLEALRSGFAPASLALLKLDVKRWNEVSPHSHGELLGLVVPSKQPSY